MEKNQDLVSKVRKLKELSRETLRLIEDVRDEEEDAYDNLPEGLQDSDRGYDMQDNISDLDEAISSVDEVDSYIFKLFEGLVGGN